MVPHSSPVESYQLRPLETRQLYHQVIPSSQRSSNDSLYDLTIPLIRDNQETFAMSNDVQPARVISTDSHLVGDELKGTAVNQMYADAKVATGEYLAVSGGDQGLTSLTDKEHKMTLMQGVRLYPKAIAWSILISSCIIMEGYDVSRDLHNRCTGSDLIYRCLSSETSVREMRKAP